MIINDKVNENFCIIDKFDKKLSAELQVTRRLTNKRMRLQFQ